MKGIGVKYIKAQNKDILDSHHLVIQTEWMQLVGCIHMFPRTSAGENRRLDYLADETESCFFAKAKGYRIYISLCSALKPVSDEELIYYKNTIHEYLQEMVEFYTENMSEGMRGEFADKE